ncbi:MAG: BatD family protein, partial [Bacteroidota bacterium]
MRGLLLLILSLATLLPTAHTQSSQEVSFTAYADAREVLLNTYFELTFTLKNAESRGITPPELSDFRVLSGPNQGFQTSIINGRMTQQTTYSYRLQALRAGTLTIGAASVKVGNDTYRTDPIQIKVVSTQSQVDDGTPEVFIVARLAQNSAYLGQQLVLDYILSARVDVEALTAVSESSYEGFYSREIHQYDTRAVRELHNGVQYVSRTLKRVVLYPQQTGTLTIDPLNIVVGVPIPGQRSGGFFSRPELRRVPVASEEIQLTVNPLPEPRPANYSGITGNFTMRTGLNRDRITTDDAITLRLTLEGSGDLKRVQAPELNFPAEFELYDPKVVEEEYIDLPARIKGRKSFEYLLVPKQAGNFTFQPEVVVFNPDSNAYQNLQVAALSLEVRQGSGEKQSGLVAEATTNQGLYPPKTRVSLVQPGNRFYGTPLFWSLLLLPVVVAGGLITFQQIKENQPDIDPVLLKKQRARAQALGRLETAEQHRQKDDARSFYEEVEKALLGYISDKLQIPRADLTKANVQAKLQELGAS